MDAFYRPYTPKAENPDKRGIAVREVFAFGALSCVKIPLFASSVPAGFPSPADDYVEKKLDFNEYLVKHPAATFCVRVSGSSMTGAGIRSGDILVVDRAVEPSDGRIVVAVLAGELTVKRIMRSRGRICLVSENPEYGPMEVTQDSGFEVWGVVTHVIHHAE
ncbi:MAG: translesion error-prone DNA polymerase V autoproteolytic subunit [Spirochaetes bacterium]|jgi:DNA polymerase V|nr:translesion error-prone DNA polymerase V autoproteolytic subunit [Spirochaetota bacterium]